MNREDPDAVRDMAPLLADLAPADWEDTANYDVPVDVAPTDVEAPRAQEG